MPRHATTPAWHTLVAPLSPSGLQIVTLQIVITNSQFPSLLLVAPVNAPVILKLFVHKEIQILITISM